MAGTPRRKKGCAAFSTGWDCGFPSTGKTSRGSPTSSCLAMPRLSLSTAASGICIRIAKMPESLKPVEPGGRRNWKGTPTVIFASAPHCGSLVGGFSQSRNARRKSQKSLCGGWHGTLICTATRNSVCLFLCDRIAAITSLRLALVKTSGMGGPQKWLRPLPILPPAACPC